LSEVTRRRAELAEDYFEAAHDHGLQALGIELPPVINTTGAITNWHMFQVVLPAERLKGGRAAVMQALRDVGIGAGVHYPPVHLFSFYRALGWREGQLPQAERIGRAILTLPLFPSMSRDDVQRVCRSLADACRSLLT
jgi:dTDP-4-amino-4,6-dideoxygalactose transaminase